MSLIKIFANKIKYDKLKVSLVVSFFLSLTLLLFGPVDLYFTNIKEMPFSFSKIVPLILAIVLVVGFIISLFLWCLKDSLHARASALVFSLGLLFWIQGNILVWDYGLFDGHKIVFEDYFWNGVIDSLSWICIIIAGFLYYKSLYRHIVVLCSILLIAQAAGLVFTAYSAPGESEWKNLQYSSDHNRMYEFSSNMNVIIIILDAFQADIFQEIIDEDPEYRSMLNGFTYYRNNVAGFSFTNPSVSYILSGKLYDNSIPFSKFLKDTMLQNSLPLLLKENGFRVDMKPEVLSSIIPSSRIYDTIDGFSWKGHTGFQYANISELMPLYRLTFFRFVPQVLKQYCYPESPEGLSSMMPEGAIQNDLDIYYNFNSSMRIDGPGRIFKVFHLKGTHVPYILDENLNYAEMPQNTTGYKSQAKASLKISYALLESLKRNYLYNSSMIFIIGDHGSGVTENSNAELSIPSRVIPLMLVKPFNSTGQLKVSDSPVTAGDIPKTVAEELKIKNDLPGLSIRSVNETDSRIRICYVYGWRSEDHDIYNEYLSPLNEYQVSGFSWNVSSWKPTYYQYTSSGVKYVPPL